MSVHNKLSLEYQVANAINSCYGARNVRDYDLLKINGVQCEKYPTLCDFFT